MGNILKSYRYRLVDNSAFEIPLPISFSVMYKDCVIAEYNISADEKISVHIVTRHKEEMLTPVHRALAISDIYYLFSCRAFQDKTPFTLFELSLLGLKKYNVYDIVKKTRGITPFDAYWIKFEGDDCTYDEALEEFNRITEAYVPPMPAPEMPAEPSADVDEILNQHRVDVSRIPRDEPAAVSEPVTKPAPAPEPATESNKMSQDEIEALLVSAGLEQPEPAPAPESSGGKMSQEDIEKLIAGASAEAAPEPAPAPESSGGKMSQEDIEKLIAGASAEAAPEPAPAPESSGGKMSQEDIEKLLNSMSEEAAK